MATIRSTNPILMQRFREDWKKLADHGLVDGVGGKQYQRLRMSWHLACCPWYCEKWIRQQLAQDGPPAASPETSRGDSK